MRIGKRIVITLSFITGLCITLGAGICFLYIFPVMLTITRQDINSLLDAHINILFYSFNNVGTIDQDELEGYVKSIRIKKTGRLVLIDNHETYISGFDDNNEAFSLLSLLLSTREEGELRIPINGVSYLAYYKTVPFTRYKMVALIKQSEIITPFITLGVLFIATVLITAMVGFFFLTRLFRYIKGKFDKMQRFSDDVAAGHLQTRLVLSGRDEFSSFATGMNIMMENMEKMASEPGRDFLSKMSHEIRTPINAIVGMATIARNTENIEKIKDCLGKIITSSTHLIGIINDILDYSKMASQKLLLTEEMFLLTEDMDFIDSLFKSKASEKNLSLQTSVLNIKHDCLVSDKLRLNQVLINLLSNAVKFTPENGAIELRVEELFYQAGEGVFQFSVKDTGIGIEPEQAKKLFTPFTQANEKIAAAYGGTGLGLVISKNIVQMMGGDIELITAPGEGSTFLFTIKVKAEEADYTVKSMKNTDAVPDFSGKRFLIADDIEINREICLELFQETGAVMDTAANGQEAFDMFFNHIEYYYDLILMDVKMPVLDGQRATEKIRGSGKKDAQSIKIVAMTANVMQEEIIQTQKAGMNAHIGKPLDISEAFKVIQRLFEP